MTITGSDILGTLKEALTITSFVMIILLLVEFLHVFTSGKWTHGLRRRPWLQILVAGILGATPGCIGAYAVVSFYTHGLMGLSSLVAAMIATTGDEAFVMFAMVPDTALLIMAITLGLGILTGAGLMLYEKKRTLKPILPGHLVLHHEKDEPVTLGFILPWRHRKLSPERALLLSGLMVYFFLLLTGLAGPDTWNWIKITFVILLSITLIIIATVSEHFMQEHLWGHVISQHLLRIFFWVWGTFLVLMVLNQFLNIEEWISGNTFPVILLAILVGLIPMSGPHLVFITLFVQGTIPFSVLLANSISQDGHGMLPLLAESRKNFIIVKSIKVLVALAAAGLTMIL